MNSTHKEIVDSYLGKQKKVTKKRYQKIFFLVWMAGNFLYLEKF